MNPITDQDLLLLKHYVLRSYQQEMGYIISTAVEAELRGLLINSLDKAEFYRGQQSCFEQILDEYRLIEEEYPQPILLFLSEKRQLWKEYPGDLFDRSEAYRCGYQQRLDICYSLLTGLQGFLEDDGKFGGTTEEYIDGLEKADRFAENQLSELLLDMGMSLEELQKYQVPFWREYVSVYCSNMRKIYFLCSDIESNPMPIFKKEILRLKSRNDELALSNLVEEKFQNIIEEMNNLLDQLNRKT